MTDDLYALATRVGQALQREQYRLVTAESCTGGWIAKVITDVPGSSGWFERGFVTYSNTAKTELLAVPDRVLTTHGAVSGETVAAMATGALDHSRGTLAVAVSGVAGPDGGTAGKPVGTVWLAWARRGEAPKTQRQVFAGDREAVRRQSVVVALEGVLDALGGG